MTLRADARDASTFPRRNRGAGEIFWLDTNAAGAGDGLTYDSPVQTLAAALALVTAERGDEIVVMKGSNINIAAAGLALSTSYNGLTLRAEGRGNKRASITWTTTDAVLTISGNDIRLEGFRHITSVDEVVSAILVSGTYVEVIGNEVIETSAKQFIQWLKTTTAADDLTVRGNRFTQKTAAAAAQKWIELIGADRAIVEDNIFALTLQNGATCSCITSTGTAPLDVLIRRNTIHQTGGTTQVSAILMMASTTGRIDDNRIYGAFTAIAGTVAAASCTCANNLCTNDVNKSGILDPVADS